MTVTHVLGLRLARRIHSAQLDSVVADHVSEQGGVSGVSKGERSRGDVSKGEEGAAGHGVDTSGISNG